MFIKQVNCQKGVSVYLTNTDFSEALFFDYRTDNNFPERFIYLVNNSFPGKYICSSNEYQFSRSNFMSYRTDTDNPGSLFEYH